MADNIVYEESTINVNITPNFSVTAIITPNTPIMTQITPATEVNVALTSGARGLSAYAIAVNNGFIGTEAEWLESLAVSGGRKWIDYVTGYTLLPFQIAEDAECKIFQYGYENNLTLYRKISKIDLNDGFYSTYQNGILSNLLVSKKL